MLALIALQVVLAATIRHPVDDRPVEIPGRSDNVKSDFRSPIDLGDVVSNDKHSMIACQ